MQEKLAEIPLHRSLQMATIPLQFTDESIHGMHPYKPPRESEPGSLHYAQLRAHIAVGLFHAMRLPASMSVWLTAGGAGMHLSWCFVHFIGQYRRVSQRDGYGCVGATASSVARRCHRLCRWRESCTSRWRSGLTLRGDTGVFVMSPLRSCCCRSSPRLFAPASPPPPSHRPPRPSTPPLQPPTPSWLGPRLQTRAPKCM
ncbi:hypothetical protein PLESTF_001703000 [Pleodorina starrii]|nr:hypothetical protein PLESTF_001703000 [Pleodorina starrii]